MEGTPPERRAEPEAGREAPEESATPAGGWLPPVPPGPNQPQPPPAGSVAASGHPPPSEPPPGEGPHGEPPTAGGPAAPPGGWQQPGYAPPPPSGGWQQPGYGWQQPPGYGGPPYGGWQPPPWQARPPEPGNGTAVTGFVLSLVGVGLLFVTAGLSTIFSLGFGIAGAVLGRQGTRKVDEGETRRHRGLGQAGFVIGIAGSVLSVLATVAWVLILSNVDDFGGGGDDLFEDDFDTVRLLRAAAAVALRIPL